MLPGPVSIPPPLPEMPRHASDALTGVMMAEVQALGTGRKIRIDIWTVFNYNLTENNTQCTTITGEKPCGFRWEEHKVGGTQQESPESAQDNPAIYAKVNELVTVN